MANMLDKRDRSLAPSPRGEPVDKVERFRWARPSSPGQMMTLNKALLNLDDTYQRDQRSIEAVVRIARDFDWSLFGVLKVAKRQDGTYWVFDGGHRLRACFYRSDIIDVPCIVFDMTDLSDEARAFVAGAKLLNSISSYHAFRAATMAGEPVAVKAKLLLDEMGLKVVQHGSQANHIVCIHTLQRCLAANEELTRRVLALSCRLANGEPINGEVLKGLFCLAAHFRDKDVLAQMEESNGLIVQKDLLIAIRQFVAETGKGGEAAFAKGILSVLNKNKRTKKLMW